MKNVKLIIFDFDGVICDTSENIHEVWNELHLKYGYRELSKEDFAFEREKGLTAFLEYVSVEKETFVRMLPDVHKIQEKKILTIAPVVGIHKVLKILKEKYSLGIVTSNNSTLVETYLTKHNLNYFDFLYQDTSVYGKDEIFKKLMTERHLNCEEVVYIDDESRGVVNAHTVGIKVVAVPWGYDSRGLLKSHNPDYIVDTPQELLELFT